MSNFLILKHHQPRPLKNRLRLIKGVCMSLEITDSQFSMLRSLVALAHCDGALSPNETSYLKELFEKYPMSFEQQNIIAEDFTKEHELNDLFRNITNKADHKKFFYLARVLCLIDGSFDRSEVKAIEKLQALYLDQVDFDNKLAETQTCYDIFTKRKSESRSINELIQALEVWNEYDKKAA